MDARECNDSAKENGKGKEKTVHKANVSVKPKANIQMSNNDILGVFMCEERAR